MILSTSAQLCRRSFVASPMALVAVLFAATHLTATEPSGQHQIPVGSLGYVHVQVAELHESPLFDTCSKLLSHVQTEASAFSLSRIGLDATKLSELTFLLPSFDTYLQLQGNRQTPFVLIATMSEAFQPERFATRLATEFGLKQGMNTVLTNGNEWAFFVASDHTVVMGSPAAIDWWLSARGNYNPSRLAESRAAMAGQGQILAGCDVTQVPSRLRSQLPAPIQSLSKASVATISVRLDDGLGIKAGLVFDDEGDAQHASQELHFLIDRGRALLSIAATGMEHSLKNPNASVSEGIGALGGLALIREGAAHLDQVHIEQADGRIHAEARLDMPTTSLVMLGLTAIRSIGGDANPQFEPVVEQQAAK
jgi:hypothetical protein